MSRLKSLVLAAAGVSGMSALVGSSEWRRARLLILCYHGVSLADEHEAFPELYVPPALFRRRLEHLRARGGNVLPLGEALDRLRAGTLPPRCVALTFDDGTQDFAERAVPLLREFDAPATVYVSTYYCGRRQPIFDTTLRYVLWRGRASGADLGDLVPDTHGAPDAGGGGRAPLRLASAADVRPAWDALHEAACVARLGANAKHTLLGRLAERVGVDYDALVASGMFQVMTPEQVRALPRDLVNVELHTHRHRVPHVRAAFAREIADNRAHLQLLGVAAPAHFCYPNGDYRADTAEWLHELDVVSATTCVPGLAAPSNDLMLLPRFIDTCAVSDATFDAWLTGVADMLPRRRVHRFDVDRLRLNGATGEARSPALPTPELPPIPATAPIAARKTPQEVGAGALTHARRPAIDPGTGE